MGIGRKRRFAVEKNSRCKCPEPGGCLARVMNLGEAGGNGAEGKGRASDRKAAGWPTGIRTSTGEVSLGTSVTIFVMPGSHLVASLPQIFSCSQLPITEVHEDRELGKSRDCVRLSQGQTSTIDIWWSRGGVTGFQTSIICGFYPTSRTRASCR